VQCENAIRETSEELTEKISQQKKVKKDFYSAWNDVKDKEATLGAHARNREVDLAFQKFEFEKGTLREELDLKHNSFIVDEKKHALEQKEGTKRALMIQLIQSGKSAAEIDEYLTLLNYK